MSGATIYKGSSDLSITLSSKITHLRTFTDKHGEQIIAAGQSESGEIDLIQFNNMMLLQKISDPDLAGFKDFVILT